MLLTYLLAGLAPRLGLAMRHIGCGSVGWFGEQPVHLSLPTLMLAAMLFNAGLGVKPADLAAMLRRPRLLAVGVLANALLPIGFVALAAAAGRFWIDPDETQNVLVGLALIGAMPIAGGATVWTQNADGNVPLSLGLVLCSTLLSPITIPLGLRAAALVTHGDYAQDLAELAAGGSGTFALVSVVIPCALGIFTRRVLGDERVRRALPFIKLSNQLNILLLSYSNAAGALTQVIRAPDFDLLALVFGAAFLMCAVSFAIGAVCARRLGASEPDVATLTFATGMNNSSASAVLAATSLADHPLVLLPILAYSLLQKVLAGSVDVALRGQRRRAAALAGHS